MTRAKIFFISLLALICAWAGTATAEEMVLTMSTTTSTQASGLLDVLLPGFEQDTGIKVKVIPKGTGAAIRDGEDGNVDIIFVHAKEREMKFVADGFGTKRYSVMHNDFVILGPDSDPAGIKGMTDASEALKKIAASHSAFISRGDDSGTHTKEQQLWTDSGVPLATETMEIVKDGEKKLFSSLRPADSADWYLSIGQGMGKTITYADEKMAYTLADRGTFIKFKYGRTPAVDLDVLCEGDEKLSNPYGIIPVNPERHPHVRYDLAMRFTEWITSAPAQDLINGYRLMGKQLFYGDAQN